jgi:hypothetical protein
MCATWLKESNPVLPVERFEKSKIYDAVGAFNGFTFPIGTSNELDSLLQSSVRFKETLSEFDQLNIIRKAIFSVAANGVMTTEALIREISREEDKFVRLPPLDYVLLTGISLTGIETPRTISLGTSRIRIERSTPKSYTREKILRDAKQIIFSDIPKNYSTIRVYMQGRSIAEAAANGTNSLEFLRGIWNFGKNRLLYKRHSGWRPHPINEILLAPIHTLHNKDGSLAVDTFWYDSNYMKAIEPLNLKNHRYNPFQFDKMIRKKLRRHFYGDDLKKIFIRYAGALDSWNLTTTFVGLWSLLEMLTSTVNDRYDETVRRACFLFPDRDYHHQILNHLRGHRNQAVHSMEERAQMEELAYQLKFYVDSMLAFHTANSFKFKSLKDACQFLSLPFDMPIIKNKISILRKALRFRA